MIEAMLPEWMGTTSAIASVLVLLVAVLAALYLAGPTATASGSALDE
jgi:hypothetical protein